MLRVGVIDYINFYPLFAAFQEGAIFSQFEWKPAVPSALNKALYCGDLDVSPISSSEYLLNRSGYGLLPDFCIGAGEKVMSVCLHIKGDISSLDGIVVGLTAQSASSALLVKVLCHHFWKVSPTFVTMNTVDELKQCDAFLLIGDDSLRNPKFPGYTTVDLATAWYRETQLPFTFAVFAARSEVLETHPKEIEALRTAFQQSYAWATEHPDIIVSLAYQRCPIPVERIKEYYSVLRYRFDDSQQKALDLYGKLIETLPPHLKETTSHVHANV